MSSDAKVKIINAGGNGDRPLVTAAIAFDVIEVERGIVLSSLADTRTRQLNGNGFTTFEFNNLSGNFVLAPIVDYALRIVYELTVALPDDGPLDQTPTIVIVSEFYDGGTFSPFSADLTGNALPEPATAALLATGLLPLAARRRARGPSKPDPS